MKGNTTLPHKDLKSESKTDTERGERGGVVLDKQREGIIRRISDR